MLANNQKEFIQLFKELEDPRDDDRLSYPLKEILFLALAGVLSGAEGWRKIVRYGQTKLELLRKFFPYTQGIPSRYTLMKVFSLLDKKQLEIWLLNWSDELLENLENELIAIDGKALRGASKGGKRESSLYLLNAFATSQGLTIAHQSIGEKTNEITAIPKLLNQLSISGAIISIDAIGCQKNIADLIIEKNANYFLALKENHPNLFEDVKIYFDAVTEKTKGIHYFETLDKGHGRVEIRRCWCTQEIDWLKERNPGWKNIKSICMIESERFVNEITIKERRYYISSCAADAKVLLDYSRKHWAIENNLHWVLDVQLNEDASQVRQDNAAENMGVIRKVIFNLVKKYKQKTGDDAAISTVRLTAAWDDQTAQTILDGLVC